MPQSNDLPPLNFTPQEARATAMEVHASVINDKVEAAAERGIYPGELGAFVLNQFIDFDGTNFSDAAPTPVQTALIDRSGPGQAERDPHAALLSARDGSGAKKMIRDGIAGATRSAERAQASVASSKSGDPPSRSTDKRIVIRVDS